MSALPVSTAPVLPGQHPHLARVLFDEHQIAARVAELGQQIAADYQHKDLVLIGVLKGSFIFLADLCRALHVDHQIDVVGAHSYRAGAQPAEQLSITKDLDLDVRDRDVLVIEDIYDSGRTLQVLVDLIRMNKPRSLELCAFLSKRKEREHSMNVKYVGFEIEDEFVVGYGLDFKEHYRSLRCVGVLHPELYQSIR